MEPTSVFRRATRLPTYICSNCFQKRATAPVTRRKRFAGVIQQWRGFQHVRAHQSGSVLNTLEERGFVNAIAGGRDELDSLLTSKPVAAYVGVDPTAPSMHVGHLLPFFALFWLHIHGHSSVALVGGSTASVGDPTGRTTSRTAQGAEQRETNTQNIAIQLQGLWERLEILAEKHGHKKERMGTRKVLNNATWLKEVTVMELLSTLGTGLRMGSLLSRDTVKTKLDSQDGMSFAEFTYPLLQSWDWWHMYHTQDVQLQIGGSDQFGNIITGIESIKHITKTHQEPKGRGSPGSTPLVPFGFTVPLLTTSSGEKFGKSAGNAIWLDKTMTRVFDLYGFFVRTADSDVNRYLKLFTLLPMDKIEAAMAEHEKDASKRVPHHLLAKEFVSLVHGEEDAEQAQREHRAMFQQRSGPTLAPSSDESTAKGGPTQDANLDQALGENVILPASLVMDAPLPRLLALAGLVESRSQGIRLIRSRGAYIGVKRKKGADGPTLEWTPITEAYKTASKSYLVDRKYIFLRVGKWNVRTVTVVSDDDFRALGLPFPETGKNEK